MSSKEHLLVTIVTPSLNQGQFLEAAIQSVLAQDYPAIEYILIDGGSSDDSLEIIRKYAPRFSFWVSEPDRGQAHAINKGLLRAHGEILGWLNSDDMLKPDAVSNAVAALQGNPSIEVVYGRLERVNTQGKIIPTPLLPKDRVEFSLHELLGECVVNQPGSFWKRTAAERAGLLDESLHYALDYEFWGRLALNGARFKRLPQVVASFRLSPESKTVAHAAEHAQEQLRVLEKAASVPNLSSQIGLQPSEIEACTRRTRAAFCLQAFYGEWKRSNYRIAFKWLARALRNDPWVAFQRRWLDLWLARLNRPPD